MPATPKHAFLYQSLGWQPPVFVHVGLLQNGKRKKLSKRDRDIDVHVYREKGYLPEALNNFVALLGWSHTRKEDLMSMQDLIDEVCTPFALRPFSCSLTHSFHFIFPLLYLTYQANHATVLPLSSHCGQHHRHLPQTRLPPKGPRPQHPRRCHTHSRHQQPRYPSNHPLPQSLTRVYL